MKKEKERQFLERLGETLKTHEGGDNVPCSLAEFKRLYRIAISRRAKTWHGRKKTETACPVPMS